MKLKIYIDFIKETALEIKECWKSAKEAPSIELKTKYLKLVYMNIMFYIVYFIPVLYFFYGLIWVFVEPFALVGLAVTLLFITYVVLMKKYWYPLVKRNYINETKKKN